MEDTVWKFNEAVYFLNAMRGCGQDQVLFTFNLSAFLAAARSTTLIMQEELANKPGFSEWYKPKQDYMKKDADFQFFNALRVDTIHKRVVRPVYTVRTGSFTLSANASYEIPIGIVDEKGILQPSDDFIKIDGVPHPEIEKPPVNMGFSFDGKKDEGAIEVCEKYVEKIRAILTEWQSHTGKTQRSDKEQ